MSEPTLQDCINYMRSQIKQMEKYPRSYEFNLPYYRKTVELLEKLDRPHGEWIEQNDNYGDPYYECSVCEDAFITLEGTPKENHYNFCPNCGADMRKRGEAE